MLKGEGHSLSRTSARRRISACRPKKYAHTDMNVKSFGGKKGYAVNWDLLEGRWKQQRGKAVRQWGKMMNDELTEIAGRYEELVGKLQEQYGIAKEEAKEQIDDLKTTVEELKQFNGGRLKLQRVLSKREKLTKRTMKPNTPSRKNGFKGS